MEYKITLGYLAVIIEIISFVIYFIGIWKGKTKPHAFTWLVWGVLNVIAFIAVLISGGEAGSWNQSPRGKPTGYDRRLSLSE